MGIGGEEIEQCVWICQPTDASTDGDIPIGADFGADDAVDW